MVSPSRRTTSPRWPVGPSRQRSGREVAFHPERVLMPDSSGVPLLVDLAAMRDEMVARGSLDPSRVDPMSRPTS